MFLGSDNTAIYPLNTPKLYYQFLLEFKKLCLFTKAGAINCSNEIGYR